MATVAWALASLIARLSRSDKRSGGAPATRELSDLLFVGQYLYRQGKYHEAYRLFTRLAECLPHERHDCMYYRVKCLLKLDRISQALQLIQAMLETDPDDSPRWCFMASELCLCQHKIEHARNWLSRAIDAHQYQNQADEDYDMWGRIILEKIARSKTTSEYAAAGTKRSPWSGVGDSMQGCRVDFVECLPYDLATMVLEQLELVDRVACTRVSKRWRAFITENTVLWQDMDFSGTPIPVELPSFLVYLAHLHGTPLKRLKIHHERVDGEALVSSLASSRCYQLHTLDLQDILCKQRTFFNLLNCVGPTLRVLRWNGLVLRLGDILTHVGEVCPRLVELDISYCFTSRLASVGPPGFLEPYGASLPKGVIEDAQELPPLAIQILRLSSIYELRASELAFILHRVPKITQLNLEHCLVSFVPIANIIRQCCPLLERITYHRHRHTKQPVIGLKAPSISMLSRNWREIRLQNAVAVSDTIFRDMVSQSDLRELETLDLGGNPHLTDQALFSLIRSTTSFARLSYLSLADCMGLTEKGLIALIAASANLEAINLAGLLAVTDPVLDRMPVAALHTVDLRRCSGLTARGLISFVDRRQATLDKLYLSHDLVSPEALGYVMRKIKYDNI